MTIAKWFIDKNYSSSERYAMSTVEPKIINETEKAYRLCFGTEFGEIVGWFPKSVCNAAPVQAKEVSVGETVFNKAFGEGSVLKIDGQLVTVDFNGIVKTVAKSYLN